MPGSDTTRLTIAPHPRTAAALAGYGLSRMARERPLVRASGEAPA